ncbi:Rrp15p-domain-containing protein [Powellomyces hirtus]|nr:Rrp15p-domain-containing protein [Powellomyces hirtus]
MPPKRKTPQRGGEKPRDRGEVKRRKIKIRPTQDEYISPNEESDDDVVQHNTGENDLKTLEEVAAVASSGESAGEDDEEDLAGDEFDMDALEEEDGEEANDDAAEEEGEEEEGTAADGGVDPSKTKASKLASAIGKILSGELGGKDANRPILAKQKHLERAIDNEKLEAKARKVISAEKKQKAEVGHAKLDHTTTDYEKKLRKVATRGVVKLFNAIRVAQKAAEEVKSEGILKNRDAAPILSKNTFLDMIKPPTGSEDKSDTKSTAQPAAVEAGSGPSWAKEDFMMKAPKHWDEEDDDEEVADVV